ncbi:hypothetical protein CKA32_000315 [Geitlerinema sp. FC II]|nr:hypothetical protein CKA32_000315 [Geitlerinema sp. FC II]
MRFNLSRRGAIARSAIAYLKFFKIDLKWHLKTSDFQYICVAIGVVFLKSSSIFSGSSELTMQEIAKTFTESNFSLKLIKRELKLRNPFPEVGYRHLPYISGSEEPF